MTKTALVTAFANLLEERLVSLRRVRDAARSGMRVDGDHRPSNRGERGAVTAQAYLAVGLKSRIDALEGDLALLRQVDPEPRAQIAAGALVSTEDDVGLEQRYLLLPGAQGDALGRGGDVVTAVSPSSPIGRSLIGLTQGDCAEVMRAGRQLNLEILKVE
jgi:transcription elongation GreA/GreB family factor